MTPPNRSNKSKAAAQKDAPLGLADTDQPVGRTPPPEAEGSDALMDSSDRSSGSDSGDSRGKSTSFDTLLGRIVVERGLATDDEISLCQDIQRTALTKDNPRLLADVLVENEFLTRRQVDRMRQDYDAEKTTQQIPGYKIMRKLGSGAMATVFLARQLSLDRLVAIKVLPSKFSSNERFIDRFYKEGRAAAQLNHRNIVGAYDVGQAGEHHYFVMEYVDGETVYDRLKTKKRFDETAAIDVIMQVARALKHAHKRGFIHRDIKPKNIMIGGDGQVRLADLGLARALSDKDAAEAEAGRAYGTPYYISPEQIRGEVNIGPAADIYGLGATFYHMVAGRVPFQGRNPSAVMHKHLKATLIPPDHINPRVSAEVAQVIEMMMAKSRRDRYRSIEQVLEDLTLISDGEQPHYAHGHVDVGGMAALEDEVPDVPVRIRHPASGPPISQSMAFMTMLIVMILSLIGNLVLLALVLGK